MALRQVVYQAGKINCILQIHRINAGVTSVMTTMCKELNWSYTYNPLSCHRAKQEQKPKTNNHTETPKKHTKNQQGR